MAPYICAVVLAQCFPVAPLACPQFYQIESAKVVVFGDMVMSLAEDLTVDAVVDALRPLGIHHLEMPASPERVWAAIRAAGH